MAVEDQGDRSEMSIGKTMMLEEVAMAKRFSASDSSASQESQICIVNVPSTKQVCCAQFTETPIHVPVSTSYVQYLFCFNTRIQSVAGDLGARL